MTLNLTRNVTGLPHRPQSNPADISSGPESAKQLGAVKLDAHQPSSGSKKDSTGPTGHASSVSHQPGYGQFSTGVCAYPPDTEDTLFEQISDEDVDRLGSFSGSEDGQLSDSTETPEQTEDVTYRETVHSVRSFMGWHHIPTFESDYSEPDKSNNPWKGKQPRKPTRISVAMPPNDWLCQKLERLNLTVAEGYPSRAQDSAGLKRDQFIKVPKSQSRWYKMHLMKPERPHGPGRSIFSWHNTEAKVNSQFPRITRASAYPSTGPLSRPFSQESLRRLEKL